MVYKKGDVLICIPGGRMGAGHEIGKVFKVAEVDTTHTDTIYWPRNGSGIYGSSVRLYAQTWKQKFEGGNKNGL